MPTVNEANAPSSIGILPGTLTDPKRTHIRRWISEANLAERNSNELTLLGCRCSGNFGPNDGLAQHGFFVNVALATPGRRWNCPVSVTASELTRDDPAR